MTSIDQWLSLLGYDRFPNALLRLGDTIGLRPYATEIEEIFASNRSVSAAAIFCVEEMPVVYFLDGIALKRQREQRINEFRRKVWNQGLATVVVVLDEEALKAYSVLAREADYETLSVTDASSIGPWSAIEFQTNFVQDRLASWFEPEKRVDRRLLKNLKESIKLLTGIGLDRKRAEVLMAQSIFLCYLEQREIVGESYRKSHALNTFPKYISQKDGHGIDRLFAQLGNDFNGDFLPSHSQTALHWFDLPEEAFPIIEMFLAGTELETGQESLWSYDFSIIPVELISGIYEIFLKDRQRQRSAYYTPRNLATLVVEQAFQDLDDPETRSVYDGACGSGILLTTAFRKMLRAAEIRAGHRLGLSERIHLMTHQIFGSDIDETACWITAFSLYLSLLEGLERSDIAQLQRDENIKLPNLLGTTKNILSGLIEGDFFSPRNSFASSRKFDIFLSNPPWQEPQKEMITSCERWVREQSPPLPLPRRQIAAGFAYHSMHSVHAHGRIVLVLPLNIVIGAATKWTDFRQRWLELVHLDRIINFADLRHLLFPQAKHPCAIVCARPREQVIGPIFTPKETIEYWTPKADISLAFGRLALYSHDRNVLSSRQVYKEPSILIQHYWGSERDVGLIRRLTGRFGTLQKNLINRPDGEWIIGKGFHAPNKSNPLRELGLLEDQVFIMTHDIPSDIPLISADVPLKRVADMFQHVASPGGDNGRLYDGPRVLFHDGLNPDLSVKAAFSQIPFAFQSSLGAVGGPTEDAHLLQFFAAYLHSSLATYLLVMTGYSVISERPRLSLDEVINLPFVTLEEHPNPEQAHRIISEVCLIFEKMENADKPHRLQIFADYHKTINDLVMDYFGLSEDDRILISDIANFVVPSIQPKNYRQLSTDLLKRPAIEEVQHYTTVLGRTLGQWREARRGVGAIAVESILGTNANILGVVKVSVNRSNADLATIKRSDEAFSVIYFELEQSFKETLTSQPENILFLIPNVMVVMGNDLYILKPFRKRFWLGRTALGDADEIIHAIDRASWDNRGN